MILFFKLPYTRVGTTCWEKEGRKEEGGGLPVYSRYRHSKILRLLLPLLSSESGPLNFNSCLVDTEASLSASFLYMIAANLVTPADAGHNLFEECQMLIAQCTSNSESISPADLQGVKDWLGNICQFRTQSQRISAGFWEYVCKASRMPAACEQKVE